MSSLLLAVALAGPAEAATWIQLFPTGGPPAVRDGHSAVYDQANNRMIIFGGSTEGVACASGAPCFNDVWGLTNADGSEPAAPTWTQLAPTGVPPSPRTFQTAVYDSAYNDGMATSRGASLL